MRTQYLILIAVLLFGCNSQSNAESVFSMSMKEIFLNPDDYELAMAVKGGKRDRIDRLLSEGGDINNQGEKGFTVLMLAMLQEDINTFNLLLDKGADPNIRLSNGSSVLFQSVIFEDSAFLNSALEHGGNPNFYNENTKRFAIHEAISSTKFEHLKLLVNHNAKLNVQDGVGSTPLLEASSLNLYDVAFYLIKKGADYSIPNNWNETIITRMEDDYMPQDSEQFSWKVKVKSLLSEK